VLGGFLPVGFQLPGELSFTDAHLRRLRRVWGSFDGLNCGAERRLTARRLMNAEGLAGGYVTATNASEMSARRV